MAKVKPSGQKHYEVLFIIANKFTEEEAEKINKAVEKTISEKGGEITYTENWGKKKLTFPIDGNHHGYYNLIEFDCDPENIIKIDQDFKISSDIIRHLIVKADKRTPEEIEQEKKKQKELVDKERKEKEEKEANKVKKIKPEEKERKEKEAAVKEEKEKREKTDSEDKPREEGAEEMKAEEPKQEDAPKQDEAKQEETKKDSEKKVSESELNEKLDKILDTDDLLK